jgi:hypothetical protein
MAAAKWACQRQQAATWKETTTDAPCPVCWRSDGCRVAGDAIACVWYPRHHLAKTKQSTDGTRYGLYDQRAFRHVPPIDTAVELLLRLFFCRTDLVAFAPPWDSSACPAEGGEALSHLLRAHVGGPKVHVPWKTARKEGLTKQAGHWRIGSYGPAPDGTTRWVVADFDGGSDHADPLADPLAVALTAYRRFWRAGVPCYLERSRSCSGWHLWVFFTLPISAAKGRSLALALLPDDALTMDGDFATIEVFPKRDNLHGRRVGHQVWLPWFCNAKRGGNLFYRPCAALHPPLQEEPGA